VGAAGNRREPTSPMLMSLDQLSKRWCSVTKGIGNASSNNREAAPLAGSPGINEASGLALCISGPNGPAGCGFPSGLERCINDTQLGTHRPLPLVCLCLGLHPWLCNLLGLRLCLLSLDSRGSGSSVIPSPVHLIPLHLCASLLLAADRHPAASLNPSEDCKPALPLLQVPVSCSAALALAWVRWQSPLVLAFQRGVPPRDPDTPGLSHPSMHRAPAGFSAHGILLRCSADNGFEPSIPAELTW